MPRHPRDALLVVAAASHRLRDLTPLRWQRQRPHMTHPSDRHACARSVRDACAVWLRCCACWLWLGEPRTSRRSRRAPTSAGRPKWCRRRDATCVHACLCEQSGQNTYTPSRDLHLDAPGPRPTRTVHVQVPLPSRLHFYRRHKRGYIYERTADRPIGACVGTRRAPGAHPMHGFAPRPHSAHVTECGRREKPMQRLHAGAQQHRSAHGM